MRMNYESSYADDDDFLEGLDEELEELERGLFGADEAPAEAPVEAPVGPPQGEATEESEESEGFDNEEILALESGSILPEIAELDYPGDDDEDEGQYGFVGLTLLLTSGIMSGLGALGLTGMGALWASLALGAGITAAGAGAGGLALTGFFKKVKRYTRGASRYGRLRQKAKEYKKKFKKSGRKWHKWRYDRYRARAARVLSNLQRLYKKLSAEDRKGVVPPMELKQRVDDYLRGRLKVKRANKAESSDFGFAPISSHQAMISRYGAQAGSQPAQARPPASAAGSSVTGLGTAADLAVAGFVGVVAWKLFSDAGKGR